MIDWGKYSPEFRKKEFDCRHTGKNEMCPEFMDALIGVRRDLGQPIMVTSGYRDPTHPVEAVKEKPGEHSEGMAADIAVALEHRWDLIQIAQAHGFMRIGVGKGFIHLGRSDNFPHPRIWTY